MYGVDERAGNHPRVKECLLEIGVVVLLMYSDPEPGALVAIMDVFMNKGEAPEALMQIFGAVAERRGNRDVLFSVIFTNDE